MTSGGYESGFVPQKAIVSGDTAPAGSYEKLWYDTSTSTLKNWNGSSWQTVKSTPDGNTITQNQNGELEVNKPVQDVIGDFENDKGDWINETGGDYIVKTSTNYALNGSQSLKLQSSSTTAVNGRASITYDLTNYKTLILPVYHANLEKDYFDVLIGGNTVYVATDNPPENQWRVLEFSVASYSGNTEIEVYTASAGSNNEHYIDNVKLKKVNRNVTSAAGN